MCGGHLTKPGETMKNVAAVSSMAVSLSTRVQVLSLARFNEIIGQRTFGFRRLLSSSGNNNNNNRRPPFDNGNKSNNLTKDHQDQQQERPLSPLKLRRPILSADQGSTGDRRENQPTRPLFPSFSRPSTWESSGGDPGSGPPIRPLRPHAITLFPGDFSDKSERGAGLDLLDAYDEDDDEEEKYIEKLRRLEKEDEERRMRWIKNGLKPIRQVEIDDRGRAYGRGARKTASARVFIEPGMGEVVVNRQPFVEYFPRYSDRERILEPLVVTETCGLFDLKVTVQGGGPSGQAGAVRLGLARALNHYNPEKYRPPLKMLGMLERDARKVERKKIGHVKARKSPTWVRR